MLSRTCTVCHNAGRPAIDLALIQGGSLRAVALSAGVSAAAVFRHKQRHLSAALVSSARAAEMSRADDLVPAVRALGQRALGLLAAAQEAGDLRTALQGIREARACVDLLARLEGKVDQEASVELTQTSEWVTLRAVIVAALAPYPEAALAVATAIGGSRRQHGS